MFVFLGCQGNFQGTKNEFLLAVVNEQSMFESLRFYRVWCIESYVRGINTISEEATVISKIRLFKYIENFTSKN